MGFELFVALRYLRAKRKGLFAMVTTVIGISGVTVGVAALITTLSVMNGFRSDIQKKIVGAQAHITIYGKIAPGSLPDIRRIIEADPDVAATAPFVLGQAILTHGERSMGVVLKGLDPAQEFKVNDLAEKLKEGSWDDLSPGKKESTGAKGPASGKRPPRGIVLGQELAYNIGAFIGTDVVLVSPKQMATPLGLVPKMRKFRVVGLLHTGYYEYDSTTAYAALADAASFFGVDSQATGIGVRLRDMDTADEAARRLQAELGAAFVVRNFRQMNQTLFAALKLEKAVMFIILTLIILVAGLNIASTLILLGVEKTRDIGLFKALGSSPRQIRRIFWIEGLIIGGSGVVGGLLLGLLLCWIIRTFPIVELPPDIYYLSRVPVSVEWRDVLAVTASGLVMTVLATVYPASRAAKVNPVEAIHYG